jgi:hypothetical protein
MDVRIPGGVLAAVINGLWQSRRISKGQSFCRAVEPTAYLRKVAEQGPTSITLSEMTARVVPPLPKCEDAECEICNPRPPGTPSVHV